MLPFGAVPFGALPGRFRTCGSWPIGGRSLNRTRAGCPWSNRAATRSAGTAGQAPATRRAGPRAGRRSPGYRPAGTLRNTFRLPNVRGTRPLGCGQRSWARGSGI